MMARLLTVDSACGGRVEGGLGRRLRSTKQPAEATTMPLGEATGAPSSCSAPSGPVSALRAESASRSRARLLCESTSSPEPAASAAMDICGLRLELGLSF